MLISEFIIHQSNFQLEVIVSDTAIGMKLVPNENVTNIYINIIIIITFRRHLRFVFHFTDTIDLELSDDSQLSVDTGRITLGSNLFTLSVGVHVQGQLFIQNVYT